MPNFLCNELKADGIDDEDGGGDDDGKDAEEDDDGGSPVVPNFLCNVQLQCSQS